MQGEVGTDAGTEPTDASGTVLGSGHNRVEKPQLCLHGVQRLTSERGRAFAEADLYTETDFPTFQTGASFENSTQFNSA